MKWLRGVALTIALMTLTLGSLASAASAAPQGPWVVPAADLSAAGQTAARQQVATGPDGTTTAVWQRSDGSNSIIQAATRAPGGSFETPVDLSASGEDARDPRIAISPDGTVTVVWRRSDGISVIIQAATRPPGGSFGTPVDLSASGQDANDVDVATAGDGTTTVAWQRSNGSNIMIQAATRPPGGSFGIPVDVSPAGSSSFAPDVAASSEGTTSIGWVRFNGSNSALELATRPPGGSFGAGAFVSASTVELGRASLVIAPDGTTTAVWQGTDGSNSIIQAATRPPGGSFGSVVDLSEAGQDAAFSFVPYGRSQVASGPDGETTVVWIRSNGVNEIVQAATRPPGGSFGTPVDLSGSGQDAVDPRVSTGSDGTSTVVWTRSNALNTIVQATSRTPGGSFGLQTDLSTPGGSAFIPQVATAADGSATAVWARFDGSNNIVQSASTAQPSPTLSVEKDGTGTGTVTSDPAGINCGTDCSEDYLSFTTVTLTATPDSGSSFTGWSGGGCSGTGTCEVTMLEATTVTADFTADPPPAGKPKLKIVNIQPKSRKVKRGKKAVFKVRVKNTGDATAKKLKLCTKGPKKLVKVPKCAKPGNLAAGKSKTVKVKVTVKKSAKKGKEGQTHFHRQGKRRKEQERQGDGEGEVARRICR